MDLAERILGRQDNDEEQNATLLLKAHFFGE
jgi:hypothetical protein